MSDKQDKLNGSQKPEAREPDEILPADYQDFEDEEDGEDGEEEYYDDEEYEDEDDEDEEGEEGEYSSDPYALAQQLINSPMFSQLQGMLGGSGTLEARMSSAKLQQVSGDLEGAADTYLDIIEEDPEHYQAHVALGQVLLAMDKVQEAETFLEKATELNPEDASGYLYLGYAHYAQEDFEKCIADFGKAVELDPDSHLSWNNLGYAQYLTGRLDEAEKTFIKAGDVGSNRAYYNLGMIRLLQGREEKAWEAYQDAADLDPRASQIEDHLEDLEQAKIRYPDHTALLDEAISRLNERLGDEEAEEDYDEDEEDEYEPKD